MKNNKYLKLIIPITLLSLLTIQCSDMGKNPGPDINDPPQITSSPNAVAIETESFTYTATATDPDGTNPTITFDNLPSWLSSEVDSVVGVTPVAVPDTSFMIVASDGELADTLLVTVSIAAGGISYSAEIQPILNGHCALSGCHSAGAASASLVLDSYAHLMTGSRSGPVVIPYLPDSSIIVRQIEGTRQPQMPLGGLPLPIATVHKIRDWIAQGARDN